MRPNLKASLSFLLALSWILAPFQMFSGLPEIHVENGMLEIPLDANPTNEFLNKLEWSADLHDWKPAARDFGFGWGDLYALPDKVQTGADGQTFVHRMEESTLFFRLDAAESPSFSNRELVSRFLQQATFGPTRDLIESFPGVDTPSGFSEFPYPHFEEWIEGQMSMEVTSLRKFWRERSNPDFVDNTTSSPFEVGHDPALGTQLPYLIRGEDGRPQRINPDGTEAEALGRRANDVVFNGAEVKQIVWYQAALTAPDVLRQRAAWALAQIFVIGESGSVQVQAAERWLVYYDIFLRHAFGNFRDILGDVTFNPVMGDYLTFVDNRKADASRGTFPDENYAREVMQLFTIGLWELNPDGTRVIDSEGNAVPTYDNEDILEIAKIFTGLRKQPADRAGIGARENVEILFNSNYIDPMRMQASWHDFSQKTLLDGSTLGPFEQSSEGGIAEINAFLDHLFEHPNTPPFIARRLIQRLTVSNPSPAYIKDVASAFRDGLYRGSGSGQRGDLSAVFKAILLHPEAREPVLAADNTHGKLREPLVRLLHYARAFNITSPQTHGLLPFYRLDQLIAQSPFDSPSVFNFYLPDYQPAGDIQDYGLYSPEFQILTDVTAIGLANAIRTLVEDGLRQDGDGPRADIGARYYSQGDLDLSFEVGLATDTEALIDHLDLILTAGRMTPQNRAILAEAIDSRTVQTEKVKLALSLVSLFPEFNIVY
jgi:uncharacterized protein (DUF1800 family)